MYRGSSFRMYVATLIVIWLSSFTIRYKVQGIDTAYTRHRQCVLRGFHTACSVNTDSCTALTCGRYAPGNHYVMHTIKITTDILRGTKCGEGKICKNMNCVDANPMPTYIGDETFDECKSAQSVIVVENRSEQCKRHGHDGVCSIGSNLCNVLHCSARDLHSLEHVVQRVIPIWGVDTGTQCGENKICVNGICVDNVGEMPVMLGGDSVFTCKKRKSPAYGPVKTRHQQCLDHGFDVACNTERRSRNAECRFLRCGYKTFPNFYVAQTHSIHRVQKVQITPLIRTKCGESGICRNKTCVTTAPENMPVYIGDDIEHECYQSDVYATVTCN